MINKYKGIVFLCVLVLLLVSSCDEIKLFWHPEGPELGPNNFLGSWIAKDGSGAKISFSDRSFSYNEGNFSVSGSATYSGNNATLIVGPWNGAITGDEGGATITTQGELSISMPYGFYIGPYIRE